MQYFLSKVFEKQFKKLSKKVKDKATEQLNLFLTDPMSPSLNNHSLGGEWADHRSINITGDIRAVYIMENENVVRFVAIGSHSELYE
jgi:addiction module RelE/StbE family toxin